MKTAIITNDDVNEKHDYIDCIIEGNDNGLIFKNGHHIVINNPSGIVEIKWKDENKLKHLTSTSFNVTLDDGSELHQCAFENAPFSFSTILIGTIIQNLTDI